MRFFDLFGKNETLFSDLGPFSFLMNPTAKIAFKSLNKVQFSPNLYLYKIESQNFEMGVRIVRECEALHIICLRIQHDMESNMG